MNQGLATVTGYVPQVWRCKTAAGTNKCVFKKKYHYMVGLFVSSKDYKGKGNENADVLAKAGTDDMTLHIFEDAKTAEGKIEEQLKMEWMRKWSTSDGCTISKLFWSEVDIVKRFSKCLT